MDADTVVRAVDGNLKILASVFGNPYFITVNPLSPIAWVRDQFWNSRDMADYWSHFRQLQEGGGSLHFNVFVGGDPLRLPTLSDDEDSTIVSSFV